MTSPQPPQPKRRLWLGAVSLPVAIVVASGLVAWLWQFPVFMVGTLGGDLNAVWGAVFTAVAWGTLLTMFIGLGAVAAVGAGLGRALARAHWAWTPVAAMAVGTIAAIAAVAISARYG